MSAFLKRWRRRLAVAVLGAGLFAAPVFSRGAIAQAPNDPSAEALRRAKARAARSTATSAQSC